MAPVKAPPHRKHVSLWLHKNKCKSPCEFFTQRILVTLQICKKGRSYHIPQVICFENKIIHCIHIIYQNKTKRLNSFSPLIFSTAALIQKGSEEPLKVQAGYDQDSEHTNIQNYSH